MTTHDKIQACMAGRFSRIDYADKYITVQVCGTLKAETLTSEQIDWIKQFYNKPDARVEIVTVKPYRHNLLRLFYAE